MSTQTQTQTQTAHPASSGRSPAAGSAPKPRSGSFSSFRGGAGGGRTGGGPRGERGGQRGGRGGKGGGQKRDRGNTGERYKPEYDQKLLTVRRVARVVAGGRRFSFAVALVAGNRKGKVGIGTGKAADTSLAIEKAFNMARKNLVSLNLTEAMSIPHEVSAKYASARVVIRPAPGKGLVAGSSVRSVLLLAGVTDITSKLVSRTKNQLNNARATLKALQTLLPARKKKKQEPENPAEQTPGEGAEK